MTGTGEQWVLVVCWESRELAPQASPSSLMGGAWLPMTGTGEQWVLVVRWEFILWKWSRSAFMPGRVGRMGRLTSCGRRSTLVLPLARWSPREWGEECGLRFNDNSFRLRKSTTQVERELLLL